MKAALPYKEWEEILWRRKLHLLGLGGIRRPEALLNEDAMWWYRNAENLTLVFPGGKSCALSQEKREECQSLVFREWDPEMLRFSDKMKDILTYLGGYIWGQEKCPHHCFLLTWGKGKAWESVCKVSLVQRARARLPVRGWGGVRVNCIPPSTFIFFLFFSDREGQKWDKVFHCSQHSLWPRLASSF